MNVVVLGGAGYIGSAISRRFSLIPGIRLLVGARRPCSVEHGEVVLVDATDADSLAALFSQVDAIVNCVTGSASVIRKNAAAIVSAASNLRDPPIIIHMSSMAVYGDCIGSVDETLIHPSGGNWYARAKANAETALIEYAEERGNTTIFRIGCAFGAGSPLWVDRIGILLKNGRLGDLGELGDGWSNLVHVNDIAEAVALTMEERTPRTTIYNLAAPDSPRWNRYFTDLALAIGCTPIQYKTKLSMFLETRLLAPPLAVFSRVSDQKTIKASAIHYLPPSLLRLFRQQIHLNVSRIENDFDFPWTSYEKGLSDSANYFNLRFG